ncbi:hypothetical protein DPMN_079796 [Dreissena polymorpha]|uniref:Uncharacterized protein n=1 Tax=Dreissena polymorpha TaxID=45954 RepID=A0A9D3YTS1_DREPO|nr:hypothetical protein DPMN_079796 [Dreissena polymorpha]
MSRHGRRHLDYHVITLSVMCGSKLDFSENSRADGKAIEVAHEEAAHQTVRYMAERAAGDKADLSAIDHINPA